MSDVKREWFEVDYYKILGVSPSADAKDITKAYRQLAREFHPDANPDDQVAEERFKEISKAYDVVGDENRRKEYDQVRRMGPMGGMFGGGGGRPNGGGTSDFEGVGDLGDLLGGLFGGGLFGGQGPPGPRRPTSRKGADYRAELDISFDEAADGLTTRITVGSGARAMTVKVPAGIESGKRLRFKGKGAPGVGGGPPGDLLVAINVAPHELYQRDGLNLLIEAPVTFAEATLGADIGVPTRSGSLVTLRIPTGTQSGRTFRVRGEGLASAKDRGDLLVSVRVVVPESLDAEQRAALEAWARTDTSSPRAAWEDR